MPLEKWIDTDLYYNFKTPLNIHQSASVTYKIPYKTKLQFRFVYFSSMANLFDPNVTQGEVEFFSLVFYLGWIRRKDIIDSHTFRHWLELLVGMTPMWLALLREIVNIGRFQNKAVASRLNISDKVARNYIAEAYNSISHLLPAPEYANANLSQCIDLVRYYHFLNLVGSSSLVVSYDKYDYIN